MPRDGKQDLHNRVNGISKRDRGLKLLEVTKY